MNKIRNLRLGMLQHSTRPTYNLIKSFSSNVQRDFKTVYKFPYVRGIGVINRLKLYQTVLTSIAVPGSAVLNQFNYITPDDILFTAIVGLGGLIPLYGLGYFANKLVGIIYTMKRVV